MPLKLGYRIQTRFIEIPRVLIRIIKNSTRCASRVHPLYGIAELGSGDVSNGQGDQRMEVNVDMFTRPLLKRNVTGYS